MKKYALLLAAGTVIGLASCGNDTNQMTQAQIDSAANAKTEAMQAEMKMKNDSLINAMAMMKADSAAKADSLAKIAAYNAGKAAGAHAKTTSKNTHTTKKVVVPPPPAKSAKDSKFDNRTNGTNTITPEQAKEKDDKFNRRSGK